MGELRKRYQQQRPRRNKDQRESGVWCMETKGSRSPLDMPGQAGSDSLPLSPGSPVRRRPHHCPTETWAAATPQCWTSWVESWLVSPQKVCSKLWGLCGFPMVAATNDYKHLLTWVMSSQALALFLLLNHTDMFHIRIWFHDNKSKNKQKQKRETNKKNATRCAQILTP